MDGFVALYIFMLAAVTGYEIISKAPITLHTPLMSGSNFIHGVVLVGAMIVMGNAETSAEAIIGFVAVMLAAANAVGGFVLTSRMLNSLKKDKINDITGDQ